MKTKICKKYRSLFLEALYDELTPEQKELFTSHLQECPQCSHEFTQLRSTLETMGNPLRPDLNTNYWEAFWNKLESRIQEPHKITQTGFERWKDWSPSFRFEVRWVYQTIAVATILLIGILIGRNYFSRQDIYSENYVDVDHATTSRIDDTSLVKRTSSYLGRSKLLLLGIVNFDSDTDDPEAIDFSRQKKISNELIAEAAILKDQLVSPQQLYLRELIAELEVVLLQIANLEDTYDLEAVELIQSSAERKGILFKIRIEELLSKSGDNILSRSDENDTNSQT